MNEEIKSSEQISESEKYTKYFSWQKTETRKVSKEAITEALKSLNEAFSRLKANRNFRTRYPNIQIDDVLPLMIKESHLNNSLVSSTKARGYFQLRGGAVKDSTLELKKLGINKTYNVSNPIDNCILGIMYFLHNKTLLRGEIGKYKYGEEFELMSYNGGAGRVASIVESYKKENTGIGNNLVWKDFAKWLAGKLEKNPTEKKDFSDDYNVYFTNWFQKNWDTDKSTITFSRGIKTEKGKIYQMINYVEKIKAIRDTNQEKQNKTEIKVKTPEQKKVVTQTKAQVQRLSLAIDYNESKDQFHGDGFVDKSWYNLKKMVGYNDKYKQIQTIKGDGVFSILRRAGIDPTKENQDLFYDINDLESDDSMQLGAYYLLPNVESKTNEKTTSTKKTEKIKEILGPKPDFYKWLDSIEVKSHELKGKLFILDPGHGGGDPGAIPLAKDGKGNVIPYSNSDIKEGQVVKNGNGDKRLHVIEAKVTMDTVYRLAKLIQEHGGIVKITHFFQNGIDNGIQTTSNNHDAPGLLDEIQNYDTWGDGTGDKFNDLSVAGLKRRVRVREMFKRSHNKKNTYFISIHADRMGDKNDAIGINILYAKDYQKQSEFAKKLAEAIGQVRNMETTYGSRQKPVYVLNPKVGATDQNVLIELGNMNNENTAYVLRNGEKRQEYAEGIFRGLLKVATN